VACRVPEVGVACRGAAGSGGAGRGGVGWDGEAVAGEYEDVGRSAAGS
jgi:hypothetical protein